MRPQKFQIVLSEKLQPTVLVVPHDQTTSRLYTFHRATKDYSVHHYRCSTCKRLSRESPISGMSFHVLVKVTCAVWTLGKSFALCCLDQKGRCGKWGQNASSIVLPDLQRANSRNGDTSFVQAVGEGRGCDRERSLRAGGCFPLSYISEFF